ncbi:MAG: DUF3703 domain-containing protein [Colwellia sp.]
MDVKLKEAFNIEITKAKQSYFTQDYSQSFYHLERAHILGQSFVIPHATTHWWMLKIGIKTKCYREISGQIMRIIASIIFSKIWVPLGNPGGANVSPIKPMPIPNDLKKILDRKN